MKAFNLTAPLSSSKASLSNDSTYLNLAIWEVAYQNELKAFWKMVTAKAKRIQYLESIDPFAIDQRKAQRQFRELQYLQTELNILVGFKEHVEQLAIAYLQTSNWLSEYYYQKEQGYLEQICQLKKNVHSLNQQFKSASFWELHYLNALAQITKEAQQKGYTLNSLNQVWI